jgi:hypothetical protein
MNPTELRLREACWQAFWSGSTREWQDLCGVLADWLDDQGEDPRESSWLRADWRAGTLEQRTVSGTRLSESYRPRNNLMVRRVKQAGLQGQPGDHDEDLFVATNADWFLWMAPGTLEVTGDWGTSTEALQVWHDPHTLGHQWGDQHCRLDWDVRTWLDLFGQRTQPQAGVQCSRPEGSRQ